jgi:SAM-dependent methyltransferase
MARPWDIFFEEKLRKICSEKKRIVDIGGSLRVDRSKNNRYDAKRAQWLLPLLKKLDYKILDVVPDYHPDIVGDIHDLPLPDNSEDAIICVAVLEHVKDPFQASREIYRVLKPGGYALVYVPFLYYYHAEPGYYGDYSRFSKDALELLFKDFKRREYRSVRGAVETLVRLSPFGRWRFPQDVGYLVDRMTGKIHSKQTSGYHIFLEK